MFSFLVHCRRASQTDFPIVRSPTAEAGADMVGGSVWCGRTVSSVSFDCGVGVTLLSIHRWTKGGSVWCGRECGVGVVVLLAGVTAPPLRTSVDQDGDGRINQPQFLMALTLIRHAKQESLNTSLPATGVSVWCGVGGVSVWWA